jgi:hypothetical protein
MPIRNAAASTAMKIPNVNVTRLPSKNESAAQ